MEKKRFTDLLERYFPLKLITPLIFIFLIIFIVSVLYLEKTPLFSPICGNGVIDDGEVCDIGLDGIAMLREARHAKRKTLIMENYIAKADVLLLK